MEENRTLSIRQAENGVIVYAEIENHESTGGEHVFTSFEHLDRYLRSVFKMPTTATLSDEDMRKRMI